MQKVSKVNKSTKYDIIEAKLGILRKFVDFSQDTLTAHYFQAWKHIT